MSPSSNPVGTLYRCKDCPKTFQGPGLAEDHAVTKGHRVEPMLEVRDDRDDLDKLE